VDVRCRESWTGLLEFQVIVWLFWTFDLRYWIGRFVERCLLVNVISTPSPALRRTLRECTGASKLYGTSRHSLDSGDRSTLDLGRAHATGNVQHQQDEDQNTRPGGLQ
jgi:hypothetical protein